MFYHQWDERVHDYIKKIVISCKCDVKMVVIENVYNVFTGKIPNSKNVSS